MWEFSNAIEIAVLPVPYNSDGSYYFCAYLHAADFR